MDYSNPLGESVKDSADDPWSRVADHFRPAGSGGTRHSFDNELIAVPEVLRLIEGFQKPRTLRVLDYGCGTGAFCRRLRDLGHSVVGIDPSNKMLELARQGSDLKIQFLQGTAADLGSHLMFDVITSIMVFQFIEDLKSTIQLLGARQTVGGELIFAVHSADYVRACIAEGSSLFLGFETGVPGAGRINLTGTEIQIRIRSTEDYHDLVEGTGMYERSAAPRYPPFSQEFLRICPSPPAIDVPKFEILSYRRKW